MVSWVTGGSRRETDGVLSIIHSSSLLPVTPGVGCSSLPFPLNEKSFLRNPVEIPDRTRRPTRNFWELSVNRVKDTERNCAGVRQQFRTQGFTPMEGIYTIRDPSDQSMHVEGGGGHGHNH